MPLAAPTDDGSDETNEGESSTGNNGDSTVGEQAKAQSLWKQSQSLHKLQSKKLWLRLPNFGFCFTDPVPTIIHTNSSVPGIKYIVAYT